MTYDPFNPGDADLEAPPALDNGAVATDDAPYGYNPNTGKPYTMSAEKRAEMGERLAAGRRRAASTRPPSRKPSRATSSARPKAPKPAPGPTYAGTVLGGLVLVAGVLGAIPPLRLDAAALVMHGPNIAGAVEEVALEDARVAALIEKMAKVTPYGALASAVMGFALQVAANHHLVPVLPQFGILSPEELLPEGDQDAPPRTD